MPAEPSSSSSSSTTQDLNIVVTCKQTRFDIKSPNYRELDIEGLNITLTSPSAKSKKSAGVEILSDTQLRLKAGQRYALVGRNGCGKSTLLKAIADKLIPGIPEETKIALLQQTRLTDDGPESRPSNGPAPTVLQEVVDKATAKSLIEHEIKTLSDGVDASDPHAPVRALRGLKHERLQKRLFILDKDARLRSGARGLQARKALKTFEKVVAESNTLYAFSSPTSFTTNWSLPPLTHVPQARTAP
jgi:ABC-type glutathione transport system ATPase component